MDFRSDLMLLEYLLTLRVMAAFDMCGSICQSRFFWMWQGRAALGYLVVLFFYFLCVLRRIQGEVGGRGRGLCFEAMQYLPDMIENGMGQWRERVRNSESPIR